MEYNGTEISLCHVILVVDGCGWWQATMIIINNVVMIVKLQKQVETYLHYYFLFLLKYEI